MANNLPMEKKIAAVAALAEGTSIRSVERMTGIHRDTIMRLGVRVGQGCTELMDSMMRNLSCERLQLDEIWQYVNKHQGRLTKEDDASQKGDFYTFVALDADTKLVPAFRTGKRDAYNTLCFVEDLAARITNRPKSPRMPCTPTRVHWSVVSAASLIMRRLSRYSEPRNLRRVGTPRQNSTPKKRTWFSGIRTRPIFPRLMSRARILPCGCTAAD